MNNTQNLETSTTNDEEINNQSLPVENSEENQLLQSIDDLETQIHNNLRLPNNDETAILFEDNLMIIKKSILVDNFTVTSTLYQTQYITRKIAKSTFSSFLIPFLKTNLCDIALLSRIGAI